MQSIGILEEHRLALIPSKYWAAHEFCFFLHDKLVHLLLEYEKSDVHNTVINAFENAINENGKDFEDFEILDFMKKNELLEPYKHHILSHAVMGLTSDMLNFLYESFSCFEKRKFSVAFSLLRKPLKEHLLFLSWILADEDDFITRFEANNHNSFSGISKEFRLELMKKAISKLHVKTAFDPDLLWDIIYSKNHENGFEPTWQRATHLTTSQGELLKTEDYSLNFIFSNPLNDDFYEFLHAKLPYIMLYLSQVTLECFNRIQSVNKKTIDHLILTTMGCYEALFLDGRSQNVSRMLQKELGNLLNCIHCNSKLKIGKHNATEFYLHERIYCKHCGLVSEFPLYWILAKSNMTIRQE
ncbi:MAG: hypothetical protein WCS55_10350 [Sulfuricurvum sp.]|uniref:hypothetical protein n=2 Tax=Sulfuricurvum sp. TaxID=2025608 RepID=UPI003561680C